MEVRRFDERDIDDWLLTRLDGRWPGVAPVTWQSKLIGFSRSNDYLFITNERGVLLMMVAAAHPMSNAPQIIEVFAWSRDARTSRDGGEDWVIDITKPELARPLIDLYRFASEWMKGMRAVRMIVGTCSDFSGSVLRGQLRGQYLVDVVRR